MAQSPLSKLSKLAAQAGWSLTRTGDDKVLVTDATTGTWVAADWTSSDGGLDEDVVEGILRDALGDAFPRTSP